MIDTLKTLCYLSGVSGCEDEVRDYIFERVMPGADELITDSMGNLLVFKRGRNAGTKQVMLCAHMDEVGLIVTDIDEEGYLRFDTVGSIDRRVIPGRRVFVGRDRVPGVIGLKALHHVDKSEKSANIADMFIDIGADSAKSAQTDVFKGDLAVFDDNVMEFGDGYIKAKAIDDRVGCAAMIKLMERELPFNCWFAFTAQEEVGARGAAIAANRLAPDIALILEGTTAADLPGIKGGADICRLGDGIVIPFMDKGAVYDRELYQLLTGLADKRQIKWQTKRKIAGATDASTVQRSGRGVKTAALSAPIRNIHTPACVGKISDILLLPELAYGFLEAVNER